MRKNILGLISFLLVLTLVVVLPFFFDNTFHNNDNYLTLYIISKSAAVLLLIVGFIYSMFFKKANATTYITMTTVILYQFIPLLVRVFLNKSEYPMVLSFITLMVSMLIAVLIIGGVAISNKKMLESDEKYAGNTIPVKDSKELYDENNKFKGLK